MNLKPVTIDSQKLFEYLVSKDRPVAETDLIRNFVPEDLPLFIRHFSVYHALYMLRYSAGQAGYYLHLDCMRIRLLRIPEQGLCGNYDAETGSFCGAETSGAYCSRHFAQHGDYYKHVTFDILRDFYLDPANITFGESDILKKLMRGIKVFCAKRTEIDEALQLFGITSPDKKNITSRYRELAARHHPDTCTGSAETMKKINGAYAILKEVYIL